MSPAIAAAAAASARLLLSVARSSSQRLTLDALRSDLSHETAAKIARLAGLVAEWRSGRFQPGDPGDIEAILHDLERVFLRHARLASARFGTFTRLVGLLAVIGSARASLRPLRSRGAASSDDAERFARLVDELRSGSRALVETVSGRYGARFTDLVSAATEEIRRESGQGDPGAVTVVLEGADRGASTWVTRHDAAPWTDVVRNFIRNAVQATEDRRAGAGRSAAAAPVVGSPPARGQTAVTAGESGRSEAGAPGGPSELRGPQPDTVTVHIQPLPNRPGTALEVLDEGVGMSAEALAAMWRSGRSSHGAHRGQGLTESKRAFVESRAGLEVRSAPNVGTCVRIELPHRDVTIRPPQLWAVPPIVVPLLVILAGGALGATLLVQREVVSVEIRSGQLVRAFDARGWVVWQRNMGEVVRDNNLDNSLRTAGRGERRQNDYLILPAPGRRGSDVVLATRQARGADRVWRLDTRGRTRWVRTLRWTPPVMAHTGNLKCMFEAPVAWNRDSVQAIALNVRDGDWSSTSIQFITPGGDSLGTYYHPGQLEYVSSGDMDGDGRRELILMGKNNRAPEDPTFAAGDPGDSIYVSCLVMLEPPDVNGQAYPYTAWKDMPPAAEEGYLVIPPIRKGVDPALHSLNPGLPTGAGKARMELAIGDGRIFRLDAHLRPLSCGVGDKTLAAALAPTRAMGPLVYLSKGRRENIDLPILRGD